MPSSRIDASQLRRIAILFEDDDLLAVAKPAGIAVHGGAGEDSKTVIELLRAAYSAPIDLQLAHRLDRGTSGVLLLAKHQKALKKVIAEWGSSEKIYLAIALGRYKGRPVIDRPMRDEDGILRPAVTRVVMRGVVDKIDPEGSLLELSIESGRTHQIRRHLADVGHPVLLDDKHGDFAANKAFTRALKAAGLRAPKKGDFLLHAWKLSVSHPANGERIALSAPLPEIWRAILAHTSEGLVPK